MYLVVVVDSTGQVRYEWDRSWPIEERRTGQQQQPGQEKPLSLDLPKAFEYTWTLRTTSSSKKNVMPLNSIGALLAILWPIHSLIR